MEPKESMMSHNYSPKAWSWKFHRAEHNLISILTQGITADHPPCPFSGEEPSPEKKKKGTKIQKHNSSFSEFPLVSHLLDQLYTTSSPTNFASTARTGGQRLPCVKVQKPVWVNRCHSLGCAPTQGKRKMGTWRSRTPSAHFHFFTAFHSEKRWKVCGKGEAE